MTRYFVRYVVKATGRENYTSFDSMQARTIWILEHALETTVLSTWEGNEAAA